MISPGKSRILFLHNREKYLRLDPGRKINMITLLWFLLAFIAVLVELQRGSINNYLIFKNVFWHTWHQENLYIHYPGEYKDLNHYGPLFSFIILPFAILPDWLGVILWAIANTWMLLYAIQQLPISEKNKNIILLFTSIEMMTSIHNVQFNTTAAAWIILSYVLTKKNQTALSCLLIVAGFLIKVYGIVGILFIVFSQERKKFLGYLIFWLIVLYSLPMVISSYQFIYQSYFEWFRALVDKNSVNIQLKSYGIDISVMGMIRRIFSIPGFPNWIIILPAVAAIFMPLLFSQRRREIPFQLNYLSLLLISICIFSTSAESPTYVIAVTGVALWYAISVKDETIVNKLLPALVLIFTSLSSTDLFPKFFKNEWIKPYSLKALPCFLVWLKILSALLKRDYSLKFKLSPHEIR
jgi:Glycosyltransferase family 87